MRTSGWVAWAPPRAVAFAALLFSLGAGVGLLAAAVMPITSARGTSTAQMQVVARPVAAAEETPLAECTPAPLERRAAQVLVVGIPNVITPTDPLALQVARLGLGGVFINDSNVVDTVQVTALTDGLREVSRLPLLVTTDEESGRVSSFRPLIGATSSPRTLAATRSTEDVRLYAEELGSKLAAMGFDSDLAPVADLDAGPSTGVIGDRSFSADAATAEAYARAFALGLTDAGLVPVVKHFPGHGGAAVDVHRRSAIIETPLTTLMAEDVQPFVGLIQAGAPVVMVGHHTYTALDPLRPASLSPMSYRLLRDLGFDGVAMTDSIGMGAIHRRWDFPEAAVKAVRAGADAVLATDGRAAPAMVDALVEAVEDGRLKESRLNTAAARMLRLKGVDPRKLTCADVPATPSMARPLAIAAD